MILRKDKLREWKWELVGISGKLVTDILFSTMKIELHGHDEVRSLIGTRRYIFAFWHSRILLLSYYYKGLGAVILVSQSDDGEIIARVLQKQGQETVRGSSTRGGLRAMAALIKRLKAGADPGVIIPDGPQGPRFKAQSGVITLAKKTGLPIIPITYSAKKIKIFNSWDRFILPRPFTECVLGYGNPIHVPENADKDMEEICRVRLEKELCRITRDADLHFGHDIK